MKTRYRVKLYNFFTEPYWLSGDERPLVDHVNFDEYVMYDNEKMFRQILDNFIDAPKKKLTTKDIRKDFDDERRKLSDNKVEVIKTYYNGRYELSKKINSDLKTFNLKKIKKNFPIILKYNIPIEMNYFSSDDNDPCDELTRCNDSYIEIEISSED